VRNCVYQATIGDAGAAGPPNGAEITTTSLASNVNGVAVRTENNGGAEVDRPFHLIVFC
jgi:hypothetical protein